MTDSNSFPYRVYTDTLARRPLQEIECSSRVVESTTEHMRNIHFSQVTLTETSPKKPVPKPEFKAIQACCFSEPLVKFVWWASMETCSCFQLWQ